MSPVLQHDGVFLGFPPQLLGRPAVPQDFGHGFPIVCAVQQRAVRKADLENGAFASLPTSAWETGRSALG
jgi:hypothetical protein